MFGGLYSINGLNDRPFLSDGTFINGTWKEIENYQNSSLRCSTFNCTSEVPTLVPFNGTTSESIGVACVGEIIKFSNIPFLTNSIEFRNSKSLFRIAFF